MSSITVKTAKKRFDTAPDLYGLFFEDISHAGDGGLYPEMLRNRSFEDSIIPEGCTSTDGGKTFVSPTGWVDEFNNGEGMNSWVRDNRVVPTPVPAWYGEGCEYSLDYEDTLNPVRKAALKLQFDRGGSIRNIGYMGVPQENGKSYLFYCFAKAASPVRLRLSVVDGDQVFSSSEITVDSAEYTRYDAELLSNGTTGSGSFVIEAPEGGDLMIGFSSLMPKDTFCGHGLRSDLGEKLRDMHPGFMRFPGGCIVEGFTMETAMFFRKTIGPVWERPSFWLLWHYRSTNGLGFHEYLQLCEDIGAEPLYVCNCGMTCQGRQPYYFNDEEVDDMLQDTLNALEYALGPADSVWGSYRAKMGHSEPFRLKYLEIGNENHGPEYNRRFLYFKKHVLAKYPELLIVANTGDPELEPDIVDDHYYNMPEFYAENVGLYDNYDRTKPDIFVGEFSVNQTYEGELRGAVSEAMFMVGFERNQDKVRLCSYAPLFEHVHYHSWYPNLIIFDNLRSHVIPSYYAFKVFSRNRGDYVLQSEEEAEPIYRALRGLPFVSGADGTEFKNAVLNKKPAFPEKQVYGTYEMLNDGYILRESPEEAEKEPPFYRAVPSITALASDPSDIDLNCGEFEAEVLIRKDKPSGIGVLMAPKPLSFYDRTLPVPTDPWKMFNLEPIQLVIENGKASVVRGLVRAKTMLSDIPVTVSDGEFHKLSARYDTKTAEFFLDDSKIAEVTLPNYPSMCSVATASDNEIYIKIVNFREESDEVRITLDTDVESSYSADRFYGEPHAKNTIDCPDAVTDETVSLNGAAKEFVYTAPGMSVNALRLTKKS